jgi:5-methylcytosine-specific restriction protein A
VHQWRLRTDPGYLRAQVFARDRGVCAVCGTDTEALRKDKRKLDYAARRQFENQWGARRNLWDADHIVPVAEDGGECDLSNMRTLCVKCHLEATTALRRRLREKRAAADTGKHGARNAVEVPVGSKKARLKRGMEASGSHGVHGEPHARKSEGETAGQYERDRKGRRGQYGSAGNSPLTKK